MSRTLIYLIAIFALWMYFSFGSKSKPTVEDFDKAGSGSGGTLVSHNNSGFSGTGGKFGSKAESVTNKNNGSFSGTGGKF